ncbi:MAG TPA: T9SS type A sorting domain-containing protein, partial [Nitrosopumilaceae archaeon]|nr:T9SS type A sorting domain-containing protein [Nitrosopumilaceae archaeon]
YANASGANVLGLAFPFISGPFVSKYAPPYRFMKFPATYGTSIIDSTISTTSFAYPVLPADSMKIISHMHYTETMDGWGNATTPAGTFPCLRDIAIRHHTDSTFTRNTGVWTLYNAPTTKTDTFYFWYGNNQKFLVAEIQIQQGLSKQGFYLLSSVVTGVSEPILSSEITLYPNPFNVSTILKINPDLIQEKATFEIYDITGREVELQNLIPNKKEYIIERGNMKEGIYFYKLINSHEIIGKGKLIIN